MTIAIDRSGSTYGKVLATEVSVVQQLCNLRLPSNTAPISLVPWSSEALNPIRLPQNEHEMMRLIGQGGTNPCALYQSRACLAALKNAGIWVLMTDGEIQNNLVESFALKTAEVALHNKPCVIIVFGDTSRGPPAACNISVGIAIYAVVPDCLFLFHDIPTGIVRVMQVKGNFRELLSAGGPQQQTVTRYTAWAELPRFFYEQLLRVSLPEVAALETDELQLQGGNVIKLDDLLSGKTDQGIVEKIIKNDDDLRSIVLASMTRGTSKSVDNWLQQQQMPLPQRTSHPRDVSGARSIVDRLLSGLKSDANEAQLQRLRQQLRAVHKANLEAFKRTRASEVERERNMRRYNNRCFQAQQNISAPGPYSLNMGSMDYDMPSHLTEDLHPSPDAPDSLEPVCLPGFKRTATGGECNGKCMLCENTSSALTLLIKSPLPSVSTANFPAVGSHSKLVFPLAMGAFGEMDLVSFYVCCDACAGCLKEAGVSPLGDTVTNALCLVDIGSNQGAWLEALDQAVKGRFEASDLLAVCLAILDRKLIENEFRNAPENDKQLFRNCAQWTIRQLAQIITVPPTLSAAFATGKETANKTTLAQLISTKRFANPGAEENDDILLLRYPIPGFMVLLRLQSLLYVQTQNIETLLFQRVLFRVVEQYHEKTASGESRQLAKDVLARSTGNENDIGKLNAATDDLISSAMVDQSEISKVNISISDLVSHGLLDQETLGALRTQPEFETVEKRGGPAMAVFLQYLLRFGFGYPTATACFNVLKSRPVMKEVFHSPLVMDTGVATEAICMMIDAEKVER